MHRLAVADERLDALGHYGLGLDRAALRPHPDPVALGDALFLRQFFRDFHEEFRLQNGIHRDVLRPVVEMLGQAVGSRRIGELLRGRFRKLLEVVIEDACYRIAPNLGRNHIGDRRFKRLVMGRERTVTHHAAAEQARGAFRIHDERTDLVRLGGRRDVRHIITGPFRTVPFDELAARIPRLAVEVGGGAVIENATICRPRPRPVEIGTCLVRIMVVAAGHIVASLGEAAGIDPAARCRRTVVA